MTMEVMCSTLPYVPGVNHNGFTTDGVTITPTGTITPLNPTYVGDPPCTCGQPWWSILPPPPCPYHSLYGFPVPVVVPVLVPMPVPTPLPADMKELAQKYREMADAIDPDGAPSKGVKETLQQLRDLLDKLDQK